MPLWVTQLPDGYISFSAEPQWQQQLLWLNTYPSTTSALLQVHLLDNEKTLRQQLQGLPSAQHLVVQLHAQSREFALGQTELWFRWPELHQRRINEVTQHLDLLPTLLAELGCYNQQNWLGDNLLHPVTQAKLNLLNKQLYSFRKDKMLVVNEDGSYSVWSAGTLLRLEQRLDLPMLTDALKRLPQPAPLP